VGYDTTRDRPAGFFITPDTAPPGLSVQRPRWVVPMLLLLFAASSAVLDRWILPMTHAYGRVLEGLADVPPGTFGKQASVAVRPLMLLLALLLAIFAGRFVRFLLLSILTLMFGPDIVRIFGSVVREHWVLVLAGIAALVVLGTGAGIWSVFTSWRKQMIDRSQFVAEMVDKDLSPSDLARGLATDGLSGLLAGFMNSFPDTAYAENVGLIGMTKVKSRWVITVCGVLLLIMGIVPKIGQLVAGLPGPVIGGAATVMFAMVTSIGIRTLHKVEFEDNHNLLIVATALSALKDSLETAVTF
jgi:NCS2 family nucleobase:cation symporter-2